jgi:CheY-like chemotaxis protein
MMANAEPTSGNSITATQSTNPSSSTRKKRILIVDDERDITGSIKSALKSQYWVDIGGTASEALHSYKPHFYDLNLLDYRMPNMDGFAFYHHIKSIDPEVKICFITAYEELNVRIRDLKWRNKIDAIFQDQTDLPVLKKPFNTATLKAMVSRLIGE